MKRFSSKLIAARAATFASFALYVFGAMPATAADPSMSKKLRLRTKDGQALVVRTHAMWNHDCSVSALPSIQVTQQPAHGRVELREAQVTAGMNLFGVSECEGQKMRGLQVVYLPEPDGHGKERFSYEVDYRKSHENQHVDVVVDVE